ncbi:hypothetical protein LCL95_09925 [Bacillus timonensis]|nr:hypothetical protein [Bacillus timonensis]
MWGVLLVIVLIAIAIAILIFAATQDEKVTMCIQLSGYIVLIVSILWTGVVAITKDFKSNDAEILEIIGQVNYIQLGLFILSSILLMAKGFRETYKSIKD